MKKLLLLFVCSISLNGMAQVPGEKLTPQPVKDKFSSEYAGASLKRWEGKLGKKYEAVFVFNNKPARARYNDKGESLWNSFFYKSAEIPPTVTAKVLAEFPGFKADWAHEITNKKNSRTTWVIRFSKPGYELKVWLNPDGTSAAANANDESLKEAAPSESEGN